MTRTEILEQLTRNGAFLADMAVLDAAMRGDTKAEQARVAIAKALDGLERQGYITFTPAEQWPGYIETKEAGNGR